MKSRLLILGIVVVLLLAGCNTAAEPESAATLSASGTGSASTNPDVVDIQLGVDTVEPEVAEAVDQNTVKMKEIMALFGDMGVDEKDIQTTNYNLWVEEVYDPSGQPTGEKRFHVSNTVSVRLRNLTQIGNLIEEATQAGVTNVFGITFGVADTTELEQAALENAIDNAHGKVKGWPAKWNQPRAGGQRDRRRLFLSPDAGSGRRNRGVAGDVPISQGQFSITAQVQVIYELLP